MTRIALLIPAYQPTDALVTVVSQVVAQTSNPFDVIVVVDDGSDQRCAPVFAAVAQHARATVLARPRNEGKGASLRFGCGWLLQARSDLLGIVTADADGQHLPPDIVRVGRALLHDPDAVVLGVRSFDRGVPLRSRLGNLATRRLIAWRTGVTLQDTQTGLRGWPRRCCERNLSIGGDRYEHETAALLTALAAHDRIVEVPIATVYEEGNRTSHFRPLRDSVRIYACLLANINQRM